MNDDLRTLDRGILLGFDRERAKCLFGAKQPDVLREFLESQLGDANFDEQNQIVDLDGAWETFQRLLTHPSLSDESDRQGFAMCLLGGRPLPGEPLLLVRVIRPDIVPHISQSLASLPREKFGQLWESDSARGIQLFDAVQGFYERAAQLQNAVVFAASVSGS